MSWYGSRSRYRESYGYGGFAPYVPVAVRKTNALRHAKKLAKKEKRELAPVTISGRAMATTYWGKAWCENLEAYSDFSNRLPRGRTYARNGSVIDLQIKKGKIEAIVSGSQIYTISISIETLKKAQWNCLKADCAESFDSLIDLLQGRFDTGVMQRLAHPKEGLFPQPKEIKMKCSCPDYAGLCKHLVAVLYGVGNRLDNSPELLFVLRNVDHLELVSQAVTKSNLDRNLDAGADNSLADSNLGEMFGIDLVESRPPKRAPRAKESAAHQRKVAAVITKEKSRLQTIKRPKAEEPNASSAKAVALKAIAKLKAKLKGKAPEVKASKLAPPKNSPRKAKASSATETKALVLNAIAKLKAQRAKAAIPTSPKPKVKAPKVSESQGRKRGSAAVGASRPKAR